MRKQFRPEAHASTALRWKSLSLLQPNTFLAISVATRNAATFSKASGSWKICVCPCVDSLDDPEACVMGLMTQSAAKSWLGAAPASPEACVMGLMTQSAAKSWLAAAPAIPEACMTALMTQSAAKSWLAAAPAGSGTAACKFEFASIAEPFEETSSAAIGTRFLAKGGAWLEEAGWFTHAPPRPVGAPSPTPSPQAEARRRSSGRGVSTKPGS
mmetsp:Transcript_17713/g.62068  ORF Transcript_17713/g.62068 Transcript_17713/m.62068 type:complete len:213 (-) Transcript_17713:85-723(-)